MKSILLSIKDILLSIIEWFCYDPEPKNNLEKWLKFLFPIPGIIIFCILGFMFWDTDDINSFSEWMQYMSVGFLIIVLPFDAWYNGKRKKKHLDRIKENELKQQEALKNYQNAITKMGELFVSFFKENYYVETKLIDAKKTDNGYEFVVSANSKSQMDYIFSKQEEIAVNFTDNIYFKRLYDSTFLIKTSSQEYNDTYLCKSSESRNDDNFEPKSFDVDPFFEEAGRCIVERGNASIGMIQRIFKIGFIRANRIMEQLHDAGVVGEEDGTKPRKILMSIEEYNKLLKNHTFKIIDYDDNKVNYSQEDSDLSRRIKMYNNKFDYMEGHDFESFCAGLLRKNGYNNVEVTRGSGDQGIDIIAFKEGVKYGIQCKCYSQDIGNKAVQEAFSGAKFYDCHVPVVITNRYFTSSAKELAQKTGVLLWDRDKLQQFVDNSN